MKRIKPIQFVPRKGLAADAVMGVLLSKAPKDVVLARSYEQLVTRQGVHPDRAKQLLGLTEKKVVASEDVL